MRLRSRANTSALVAQSTGAHNQRPLEKSVQLAHTHTMPDSGTKLNSIKLSHVFSQTNVCYSNTKTRITCTHTHILHIQFQFVVCHTNARTQCGPTTRLYPPLRLPGAAWFASFARLPDTQIKRRRRARASTLFAPIVGQLLRNNGFSHNSRGRLVGADALERNSRAISSEIYLIG